MKANIILSAACLFLMVASSVDAQNYPPQNLYVDPLSLLAIWDPPDTTRPGMSSRVLIDYYVFLDDSLVGVTTDTLYPLDSLGLSYGTGYTAGVAAHYSAGLSDTVRYVFTSLYIQPLDSVNADCDNGTVTLSWSNPDTLSEYILGYNIYRDGDFVNYVPYQPIPVYIEEIGLGFFCYTVTIVYDLTPWGYPGEEGESMEQGPACPTCEFGFDLPFFEDWLYGSFDHNLWTVDGANWTLDGQIGSPPPCALFESSPQVMNYNYGLESYPLKANNPLSGQIFLDCLIKLDDVTHTGTEYMLTQVWNWDSQEWHTLDSLSNIDGSFGWMSLHLDITPYALHQVFKVRFLASGENSANIQAWYVDNIHIYRKHNPPTNLSLTINGEEGCMDLDWDSPDSVFFDEWIHYDDGVNFTAVGSITALEFDAAARWEPLQLADYQNCFLSKIAFFPTQLGATYRVRVWTGAGPANMVVDQPVDEYVASAWNIIELEAPLPIDITQELWVGYYVYTSIGYPAGCDDGPAVDGYGNMMNYYGWKTLLEMNSELDFNWNIQAYIEGASGQSMIMTGPGGEKNINTQREIDSTFSHYNIYRSVEYQPMEFYDTSLSSSYKDYDMISMYHYCYKVNAVYIYNTDTLVSDLSDESCGLWVGLGDLSLGQVLTCFPNPADDFVQITSSEEIQRISLYNSTGLKLLTKEAGSEKAQFDVSDLPSGIYMLRVIIHDQPITRKVVVMH